VLSISVVLRWQLSSFQVPPLNAADRADGKPLLIGTTRWAIRANQGLEVIGMRRVMRRILVIGLLPLISAAVHAQGGEIGGVFVRDVPIASDKEEWPQMPSGGFVTFESGTDWSSSSRKNSWRRRLCPEPFGVAYGKGA
jgi:hypothetical protein